MMREGVGWGGGASLICNAVSEMTKSVGGVLFHANVGVHGNWDSNLHACDARPPLSSMQRKQLLPLLLLLVLPALLSNPLDATHTRRGGNKKAG